MIYVSIDIAKLNHFVSAVFSKGKILIEPFKFTNDYDGFYPLLSKLVPLHQNNIIIGLESTAHYSDNLVRFLISRDFNAYVLNPIKTSSLRKNNVRKTKTDIDDTLVIAKTLMMQDSSRFTRPASGNCLFLFKKGSHAKRYCFHAYDPSLKPACEILTRTFHKEHGEKTKDSRTEVCRAE